MSAWTPPLASIALAASAGVFAQAAPAPARILGAAPVYREIGDWIVACDNTRACLAKFVAADDSTGGAYVSVARGAGPGGRLMVTVANFAEDGPARIDPARLRLDGKPLAISGWSVQAADHSARLEGPGALRLLRAAADAHTLALSAAADAPVASLSGLKAVLLVIDEDQGRLDGVTALARPGAKPATSVPPGAPPPMIVTAPKAAPLAHPAAFAAAVRRAQVALLKRHDCDSDMADSDAAAGLDAAEAVVVLGCRRAAYQASAMVFRAPRTAPAQARPVVMPRQPTLGADAFPPEVVGEYVTDDGWDAATASFTEASKGRGLADCGESTTWTFDGRDFQLAAFSRQERCGGPPDDWPTLYRTRR